MTAQPLPMDWLIVIPPAGPDRGQVFAVAGRLEAARARALELANDHRRSTLILGFLDGAWFLAGQMNPLPTAVFYPPRGLYA